MPKLKRVWEIFPTRNCTGWRQKFSSNNRDGTAPRALALEEGFESTALAARTRYWWARALAERGAPGDLVRARDLANACRETASSLGMARLESDAAAVARLSA